MTDRYNGSKTLMVSAARTATNNSGDISNWTGRGAHITIDTTAAGTSPSTVFTVQGKDETSGGYYTILASAAITGTGTVVLRVYPGLTAATNVTANDILPKTWRVLATHGNSTSHTYSVGASVIN